MSAHGPDAASYEKAARKDLRPEKLEGTLAFMLRLYFWPAIAGMFPSLGLAAWGFRAHVQGYRRGDLRIALELFCLRVNFEVDDRKAAVQGRIVRRGACILKRVNVLCRERHCRVLSFGWRNE